MKKFLLVSATAVVLAACSQPAKAPQDTRLKEAYSACINTAEGNPDKIATCQKVLDILREDKAWQGDAGKESISTLDYQQCLQATRTGNDQAAKARCDKIWQAIRANNNQG